MKIKETFVNETENCVFGDGEWLESFTDDRGKLFRSLQQEYGRCKGNMYRDTKDGSVQVGWVFEKLDKYQDSKETYLRHVWVEVREDLPSTPNN